MPHLADSRDHDLAAELASACRGLLEAIEHHATADEKREAVSQARSALEAFDRSRA